MPVNRRLARTKGDRVGNPAILTNPYHSLAGCIRRWDVHGAKQDSADQPEGSKAHGSSCCFVHPFFCYVGNGEEGAEEVP